MCGAGFRKIMADLNYEKLYLETGIDELKNYLMSKEIYWQLGINAPAGMPPYPQFTLGWLLLFWQRWEGYTLSPDEQADYSYLRNKKNTIKQKWQSAWEKKAADEFPLRLSLWKNYINDYRKNPSEQANRYSYEVQRRVILHLLAAEMKAVPTYYRELLKGMDRMLSEVFLPDGFIWNKVFESSFPKEDYWYLYGRIKG